MPLLFFIGVIRMLAVNTLAHLLNGLRFIWGEGFKRRLRGVEPQAPSWRRGVVVSGVRRMNKVNPPTSGPVSTWMGGRLRAGTPFRYVTSQVGQLSLASPGVA